MLTACLVKPSGKKRKTHPKIKQGKRRKRWQYLLETIMHSINLMNRYFTGNLLWTASTQEFLNLTSARVISLPFIFKAFDNISTVLSVINIHIVCLPDLPCIWDLLWCFSLSAFLSCFQKLGELFGISRYSDCYSSQATKCPEILGKCIIAGEWEQANLCLTQYWASLQINFFNSYSLFLIWKINSKIFLCYFLFCCKSNETYALC